MGFKKTGMLDPAFIDKFIRRDRATGEQIVDPELMSLRQAMTTADNAAEQMAHLANAVSNDPSRTPEAAALEIGRSAGILGAKAAAALDGARSRAVAAAASIAKSINAPAPDRQAGTALDSEIRQGIASLTPENRRAYLVEAFKSGDEAVIGATLRAPAITTRMSDHELASLRDDYQRAHRAEEYDRLERLTKAIAALDRGGKALTASVEGLVSNPGAASAAREAEEAVRLASAGIER